MANILITNICNQKCSYCFAENEFQKKKTEMSFNDFKKALSFLKKSGDNKVRLMGGEPTLHSQFKKIVDYSLKNKFSVQVFTNGVFSAQMVNFLVEKKDNIKYSFNINPPNFYPKTTWNQVNKNLEILSPFRNTLIGSVIYQKDFNIDYLIDLAKKYSFRGILLRAANPVINRNNKYISLKDYPVLVKNLIRGIKQASQNKVGVGFGCGLAKKSFSETEQQFIKDYQVVTKGWGCDGNSGRFDIGTNLSIFRCFPLSDWKTKKLSDFNSIQEIENYFTKFMEEYQSNNFKEDFIHQGPCFSYLLNKHL